ncbi:hypothetical protein [Metabacillus idriensis]|uniref:hypothetical protein n=1 Tax=Metabacillus idriensis TaxID=324768 RepID=UPI003D2898EF
MKYSKKVLFTSLGLGLAIVVGAATIVPAAIQGKEKVSYEELEKQLTSTKKKLVQTKEELAKYEKGNEEQESKIFVLEPGAHTVGEPMSKELPPGIYQVQPADHELGGTFAVYEKGVEQIYGNEQGYSVFGPGPNEEPDIEWYTFFVNPTDVIVIDTKMKFIMMNR